MIRGVHTMFYSSEPEALRAFLRDKLDLPFTDIGGGWLIFYLAEADMGVHPADASDGAPTGTHDISFYCDDVRATVAELRSRGVEFLDEITDRAFGLVTRFKMPGDVTVLLYQPLYQKRAASSREKATPSRKQAASSRVKATSARKKATPVRKRVASARKKAKRRSR
jgi:catechol 2,3-dioxygenase-like lactoylglutathione lyase family enzyme